MKHLLIGLAALLSAVTAWADKQYSVTSPDGSLKISVNVGKAISYEVSKNGMSLIAPSTIGMQIEGGSSFGNASRIASAKTTTIKETIASPFYKKSEVTDHYNLLTLRFKENFTLLVRAYDQGVAYRFVSQAKKPFKVVAEQAQFNFAKDWKAWAPYVKKSGSFEKQYMNSFENTYTVGNISQLNTQQLIFLPILVEADGGMKISITEADNTNYPGMFLLHGETANHALQGHFAPYPKEEKIGGHNNLQKLVVSRQPYLVSVEAGAVNFPWRVISVSTEDKQLLDNDMVYLLAAPNCIGATDWIKPGKVAWEWWNDWGIYNVPFVTGVNTETYKAYIDFASKHGIEYVIMDEGWAVNKKADLFQIVPEIDLEAIISYATSKNVGIILWAGYYAFDRDMERVCQHFSKMGVKGFKVDFMDRDDAKMVNFHKRAAEMCAKYHLLLDFHGSYKPTGINRTYPNVLNFEGVAGLEQNKWSTMETYNQVQYDTELPFLRMLAGQMDYTQGAMLNSTPKSFHTSWSEPMSQGTRCHQLGQYIVFFSPLNMLCDSPTHYEKEAECTAFIASVPVTWDETVPLDSKVGEYVVTARRKGNTWYVGGINNWTARTLTLRLPFLGKGEHQAEIFTDGPNSKKFAQDYLKKTCTIKDGQLIVTMAPGGGFALTIR